VYVDRDREVNSVACWSEVYCLWYCRLSIVPKACRLLGTFSFRRVNV